MGCTVLDPISVEVENDPGVMATDDALLIFQERVLVPAEATTVGEAEKEEMEGRADAPNLIDIPIESHRRALF